MALRGCLRCVKYLVFLLTFVVWLSGLAMLGAAIFLLMDRFTNHIITTAHAPDVETYHVVCYVLIGAGGVMTFVGFLGCCSAFQESRCMLGSFFTLLLLSLAAQLVCGAYAFVYRHKVHEGTEDRMLDYVQTVYGRDPYTDEPIDFIQRWFQCCGVESVEDWRFSAWHNATANRHYELPPSCCFNRTQPPRALAALCGIKADVSGRGGKHVPAWTKGCAEMVTASLADRIFVVSIFFLALISVEVLSLCLSLPLCCAMRREAAGGYKS